MKPSLGLRRATRAIDSLRKKRICADAEFDDRTAATDVNRVLKPHLRSPQIRQKNYSEKRSEDEFMRPSPNFA